MRAKKRPTAAMSRLRAVEQIEARLLLSGDGMTPMDDVPAEVGDPASDEIVVDESDETGVWVEGDPIELDPLIYSFMPRGQIGCYGGPVFIDDVKLIEDGSPDASDTQTADDEADADEAASDVYADDDGTADDESTDETMTDDETGGDVPFDDLPGDWCEFRDVIFYALAGAPGGEPNPLEGPDESESNDSIDAANAIELDAYPTFAPGLDIFGANLVGIAGGDSNDQDFFSFDTQTGYHVNAFAQSFVMDGGEAFESIADWIEARGLNEFSDAIDTAYTGGTPLFNEATGESIDLLSYILGNHSELSLAATQVIVYDADGNVLAETGTNPDDPASAMFDAPADGTYYVAVSIADGGSVDPVQYRLNILAQSEWDPMWVYRGEVGHTDSPKVATLKAGDSLEFTDSQGHDVEIEYTGRGTATITFGGGRANGSDISSIEVNGARRSSNLMVHSNHGDAKVGSIEIHGVAAARSRRSRSASRGFGRVEVDGNLGSFSSDINVRALVVDGILGEINAPSASIGSLKADVFDSMMNHSAGIESMTVKEDSAGDLLNRLLGNSPIL